ncbi:hypothetical protein QQY24_00885 [Streptomyces sp. TG1A-8]|uniref:hypothetical protein n=1 Tax=Streptomyces sp. TG1A-8 TaxID=3051385 RepID=UPI00265C8587|nr:hypothetical protein [Streptomyces sp. TG1A-8]MDO0924060.1 hypothetical protein [Streptomyces sp. TG1A-8]
MTTPTQQTFTAAVARLLSAPHLEGTFRVRDGEADVTDEYSELRFKDPRLGGYLDRTRIEQCLTEIPLTVWLRGSCTADGFLSPSPLSDGLTERNRWTVIVPPDADLTVTSPRRSFAMLKAVVGTLATGSPFTFKGRLAIGRKLQVTAARSGLVAQLDWLFESPEINLAQATGIDLTAVEQDWHRVPLAELLQRINGHRGG